MAAFAAKAYKKPGLEVGKLAIVKMELDEASVSTSIKACFSTSSQDICKSPSAEDYTLSVTTCPILFTYQ